MSAFPWSSVLLGGGALASTLGSLTGGSGRAQRKSRDWYQDRTSEGIDRITGLLYGRPGLAARDGFRGQYTDQSGANLADSLGGPVLDQMRELARFSNRRGRVVHQRYGAETDRLSGMDRANIGHLDALAAGAEAIAGKYGNRRRGVIRSDARLRLQDMDDSARAALAASGLSGSSAVADRLTENRATVGRETDRALSDLEQSVTDRMLGARGQRIGVNRDAGERMLDRAYSRSSGDTSLALQNLVRNLGLRAAPLETATNIATSGVMNPWYNGPSFPGTSGNGLSGALQTAGNAAAGLGARMYGQDEQLRLLEEISRRLGGTAGNG